MKSKPDVLRQITLFAALPDDALQRIARVAVPRAFSPGELILMCILRLKIVVR